MPPAASFSASASRVSSSAIPAAGRPSARTSSSFQPSAHFWAASSLYQLKDNAAAAEYYAKVANQWPDDNRAPDALLGLASAQQAQGDAKAATRSLERLAAKYPSSSAAQIARQRLKK